MARVRAHPGARAIAWAVTVALFALAASEFWHHHSPWAHPHPDCPVCVAAHQPLTEGAAAPIVASAPVPVAIVYEMPRAAPPALWRPAPAARGPPDAPRPA